MQLRPLISSTHPQPRSGRGATLHNCFVFVCAVNSKHDMIAGHGYSNLLQGRRLTAALTEGSCISLSGGGAAAALTWICGLPCGPCLLLLSPTAAAAARVLAGPCATCRAAQHGESK